MFSSATNNSNISTYQVQFTHVFEAPVQTLDKDLKREIMSERVGFNMTLQAGFPCDFVTRMSFLCCCILCYCMPTPLSPFWSFQLKVHAFSLGCSQWQIFSDAKARNEYPAEATAIFVVFFFCRIHDLFAHTESFWLSRWYIFLWLT